MSVCSNRTNCRPAQLCYYDLLDGQTAETVPADVREHVASCADCQSDIERLRDLLAAASKKVDSEQHRRDSAITELLSLHFAWVDKLVGCAEAKPFLASMADPLLRVRIPTPITAHLDNCQACSDELSAIRDSSFTHKQLCRLGRILAADPDEDVDSPDVRAAFPLAAGILERPDSGIATRFTFSESAQASSGELHVNRPIDVEVVDRRQAADAPLYDDSSRHRHQRTIPNLRRYIGPAVAAAAVVLLGFAVLFNNSAARALDLGQIDGAIRGADNVLISKFVNGKTSAETRVWVSRSQGIYMTETGQLRVLFDTAKRLSVTRRAADAQPEETRLNEAQSQAIKEMIRGSLGIIPSGTGSSLPPGAKWEDVTDDYPGPENRGCEVYQATWTKTNNRGEPASDTMWLYFVEPKLGRPEIVESYTRLSGDGEFTMQWRKLVEYPDDGTMRAAVKEASI